MKHLFDDKKRLVSAIVSAKKIVLLLDYDGTLSPIVSQSEDAVLSDRARKLLAKLKSLPEVEIAIVSGRPLTQLDKLLNLSGITLIGNHGFEVRLSSGEERAHYDRDDLSVIQEARDFLLAGAAQIPGTFVEDKGVVVALHYRNVPDENTGEVEELIASAKQELAGRLHFATGKKVFEVRPAKERNKGAAALEIISHLPERSNLLVFYVGDDTTDEDAFRVLKGKAWTVFVRGETMVSSAEYYLGSPVEVADFLEFVVKVLRDRRQK